MTLGESGGFQKQDDDEVGKYVTGRTREMGESLGCWGQVGPSDYRLWAAPVLPSWVKDEVPSSYMAPSASRRKQGSQPSRGGRALLPTPMAPPSKAEPGQG